VVETGIRFVVVQYHLFKNAGTTFNSLLERNFPGQVAYLHGEHSQSSLGPRALVDFLAPNQQVRAVSSHHLRPPTPDAEGFVFFDVMSLRNPLDRMRSMYDFYHRSPGGDDPLIALGRTKDLAGFLELLLDRYPHLVNNVQVNYFANGGRYTRPPDDADLQKASATIRRAAVPIVAEFFETSVVSAEYFLQPAFGTLDFSYISENVTPGRLPSLSERLKLLKKACGTDLFEALVRANELDLELVESAEKEIRRRFALVPCADKRLAAFRGRCRKRA
jgi:hypothetical protein